MAGKKSTNKTEIQKAKAIRENKQLRKLLLEKTRSTASLFRLELKKQIATAITAAFAFLIALSWRDAIIEIINKIVKNLEVTQNLHIYKLITAFIITAISVIGIILVSRWSSK